VDGSIRETYRYLLVPMQDPEAEGGLTRVAWEDEALSLGAAAPFDREIERATRDREWVIKAWAPAHLRGLLTRWFWKDDRPAALAQKVWLDMGRYLYMPRLQSADVFVQTVKDGVGHQDFFGYASGERDGKYEALLFGGSGGVYLTDTALLVRADAALAAQEAAKPPPATGTSPPPASYLPAGKLGGAVKVGAPGVGHAAPPAEARLRRFHGTVDLDPQDPIGSFTSVVENVEEHFTAQYGTKVQITVEIEARRPDGFAANTVRVVRENAGTLKFLTREFEED
jgi:hypothetical protein